MKKKYEYIRWSGANQCEEEGISAYKTIADIYSIPADAIILKEEGDRTYSKPDDIALVDISEENFGRIIGTME